MEGQSPFCSQPNSPERIVASVKCSGAPKRANRWQIRQCVRWARRRVHVALDADHVVEPLALRIDELLDELFVVPSRVQ